MAELDARSLRAEVLSNAEKTIRCQIRTQITHKWFVATRKASILVLSAWLHGGWLKNCMNTTTREKGVAAIKI
ncbi:hypothetical protein IEQ34_013389 [Dendrobium chrysotoxum]|uniref:Uncharacterized protein n=1 Tax=Dendrobium chrysotoxum TaxID=161865 RepID=A0AAV7GRJ7_DENCH|nr:hypothetical protein IEQ34_013389 [Dendrobium chrysotoxum]